MSDGICFEGNLKMNACLKGVFEHFSKTTEVAGVQFFPLQEPAIIICADPSVFASIPLPSDQELARLGRGSDQQVYIVVRATTQKR